MSEFFGTSDELERQRTIGNVNPEKVSTNQRKIIPFGRGRKICPALWIGVIENQYTQPAPTERPAKK